MDIYKMKKIGFIVGKFWPFHNGHLKLIKHTIRDLDIRKLIICIGSADGLRAYSPYMSYRDRFIMVRSAMKANGLDTYISYVPLCDINSYTKEDWAAYVRLCIKLSLKLEPNIYITGSNEDALWMQGPWDIVNANRNYLYPTSGTFVRHCILKDLGYENYDISNEVPPTTIKYLKKERILQCIEMH
jgi:cytidyltransferase-like protein